MIVDNFDLIRSEALSFLNERSMYYIPVLRRVKDDPGFNKRDCIVRTYLVHNPEEFDKVRESIINTCEEKHARAYIKLNTLDARAVLYRMATASIQACENEDWHAVASVLSSACGKSGVQKGITKRWIFDIDAADKDMVDEIIDGIRKIDKWQATVKNPDGKADARTFIQVPTRNGFHLVTKPCNKPKFMEMFPSVEIKDEGLTLLYYPSSCI